MTYYLLPLCALFLSFKTMGLEMSTEIDEEDRNSIRLGSSPASVSGLLEWIQAYKDEREAPRGKITEEFEAMSPVSKRKLFAKVLDANEGLVATVTAQNTIIRQHEKQASKGATLHLKSCVKMGADFPDHK